MGEPWIWIYLQSMSEWTGRALVLDLPPAHIAVGRAGSRSLAMPCTPVWSQREGFATALLKNLINLPGKTTEDSKESQLLQTDLILLWSSVIPSLGVRKGRFLTQRGGGKGDHSHCACRGKLGNVSHLHPRDWRNPTTGIPFGCQLAGEAAAGFWSCLVL